MNNAGYGLIGALEECTSAEIADQFATNVLGLAARAVLPTMRAQRSGHIFNMSSAAGIVAFPGASGYCSSKFAIEGLTENLAQEVTPGYMRTEFLESPSAVYAKTVIHDYDATSGAMRRKSREISLKQPGDPRKLAQAFLTLASAESPHYGLSVARIRQVSREGAHSKAGGARDVAQSVHVPGVR